MNFSRHANENTYIVDQETEDDEEDQKILNEFIDEVFPIAMMANTTAEENLEDTENEQDEFESEEDALKQELLNYDNSQVCQMINRNQENNTNDLNVRVLPKIEEEDEEEVDEKAVKQSKKPNKSEYIKRLSFSKTISTSSIGSSASAKQSHQPVIQMTKTARLRLQSKQLAKQSDPPLTTSLPVKRQASVGLSERKTVTGSTTGNQLHKARVLTSSNSSGIKTKPTKVATTNSQGFSFNLRK